MQQGFKVRHSRHHMLTDHYDMLSKPVSPLVSVHSRRVYPYTTFSVEVIAHVGAEILYYQAPCGPQRYKKTYSCKMKSPVFGPAGFLLLTKF